MVQSHSPTGGNVSSHEGTLAPPGEYDWTCASFGLLESTPQPKRQMDRFSRFAQLTAESADIGLLYNGRPYPPELPLQMGDLDRHVTHDALGPCERTNSTTQTAPRSVQPCLHRWLRSVPILYNGLPVSSSKLPLPMLASAPLHWAHRVRNANANGNFIVSAVLQGSLLWQTDRATHRPTDHATRCGAA